MTVGYRVTRYTLPCFSGTLEKVTCPVKNYCIVAYTGQGTRTTRPGLSGQVVYFSRAYLCAKDGLPKCAELRATRSANVPKIEIIVINKCFLCYFVLYLVIRNRILIKNPAILEIFEFSRFKEIFRETMKFPHLFTKIRRKKEKKEKKLNLN